MNLIICGAGQVGSHAARVLTEAGYNITVIDTDAAKLRAVADSLDVATLTGNAADAEILREAGAETAHLVIAVTDQDEVNMLASAVAKGVGATKAIARVHHGAFFAQRGLDYQEHLGIDRLICPEYSTALAVASKLRNPTALAFETFAQGTIQMQQFPVSKNAPAIGKPLAELKLPPGTRLAAIIRNQDAFVPVAGSTVEKGDTVILVGNAAAFSEARKRFHDDKLGRRRVVLMGGTPMAVWLCRSLRDRNFSIRLFEMDQTRCEELADKLDWVTVIHADVTDRSVFEEEQVSQADVYVSLRESDEENIIASVLAKSAGVPLVIVVLQGTNYIDLIYHIGVDRAFCPSLVAVDEIRKTLDEAPLQQLASLANGVVDAYRVRAGEGGEAVGKRLREVKLTPNWIVAGIRRGQDAWVPEADDRVETGDVVLIIGKHGMEKQLKKLFAVK